MKRLFVFIGLIVIAFSAFCQPTGVDGKWVIPGKISINGSTADSAISVTGGSSLTGGTRLGNASIYTDIKPGSFRTVRGGFYRTVFDSETGSYLNTSSTIADGTVMFELMNNSTTKFRVYGNGNVDVSGNVNVATGKNFTINGVPISSGIESVYDDLYGVNKTYSTSNGTSYKTITGLTVGIEVLASATDSVIFVLDGFPGVYEIEYFGIVSIPTDSLMLAIHINDVINIKSRTQQDYSDEWFTSISGKTRVTLSDSDAIKLKYKSSTTIIFKNITIYMKRIDE